MNGIEEAADAVDPDAMPTGLMPAAIIEPAGDGECTVTVVADHEITKAGWLKIQEFHGAVTKLPESRVAAVWAIKTEPIVDEDGNAAMTLANDDHLEAAREKYEAALEDEDPDEDDVDEELELVADGGRNSAYIRVDGLSADELGEEFRELANDVFDSLQEQHSDDVEGVVPVFNEEVEPRIGADEPRCAADGCEHPMDHLIHGVVLDGVKFDVPTCGRHEREQLVADGSGRPDKALEDWTVEEIEERLEEIEEEVRRRMEGEVDA